MAQRGTVNVEDPADLRRQILRIAKELNGQPKFKAIVTQDDDYFAHWGECVPCDPSGGAFAVMLPSYVGHEGEQIVVKNVTTSANTVTIAAQSGETIDGATTATIAASRASKTFVALKDGIGII